MWSLRVRLKCQCQGHSQTDGYHRDQNSRPSKHEPVTLTSLQLSVSTLSVSVSISSQHRGHMKRNGPVCQQKTQVGASPLNPELKQGINERTSWCRYMRGHRNEDITSSTGFHRTRRTRRCHNNGDIMAGWHGEVSTYRGVSNNLLEVFTPQPT